MDGAMLLKFFAAFVFVIGLMLLVSWVVRKSGLSGAAFAPAGKRRLKVVEFLPVDHRRKLVLVRRDDREHLILLGPESQTLVEADIPAPPEPYETKEQKNA